MARSYSFSPRHENETTSEVVDSNDAGDKMMSPYDDGTEIDDANVDELKTLGYEIRKLVHPSNDYQFQMQLVARALRYPEQQGQQVLNEDGIQGKEIMHTHESIFYIVSGSSYFDIRGGGEKWIRIRLEAGKMVIVPAGSYHRCFRDGESIRYTQCNPLDFQSLARFEGSPEQYTVRKEYLKKRIL
ncbi:hypothetical protein GYMLUDRAFT_604513 [Collybiopsis luxurians FD-317 M1]|uniref:acireductone dioxygenase (Fe(2+)-requiring) n=1 Tax=Collybiopsis luxurians FD-317 M1 TaxID=944289 RepID=A0A0D0BXC1_9AGAR|nr:hypothetical protein GYMLUDRAFT_604513 [Collybiopsis luxurians FD-317 M1]